MPQDLAGNDTHQKLSQYLNQVQKAFRDASPAPAWVIAELASVKYQSNGHVYLDLIEMVGGREVAKSRCTLFAKDSKGVLDRWDKAVGDRPRAGMKLLISVRAEFSPQYGFSLLATDIDSSFTLGDMEAKLNRIVALLREKGLYDLQRQHVLPDDYRRVAVISPDGAAGLADFKSDAQKLSDGGVCCFEYFSAVFQGDKSSQSIRDALVQVNARHQVEAFDVVCIIRGGGAKTDLAWLNDATLAAWVCKFPVPVMSGIGHEIDKCVIDLVACRAHDTPSKAIGFIRNEIVASATRGRDMIGRALRGIQSLVETSRLKLNRSIVDFSHKSTQRVEAARAHILRSSTTFTHDSQRLIESQRVIIRRQTDLFGSMALSGIDAQRANLKLQKAIFDKTNPLELLSRGFAIIRAPDGSIIKTADVAKGCKEISLKFSDGDLLVAPVKNKSVSRKPAEKVGSNE